MCNKLILGDNLEIMKKLPSESIDLIYIDPPFFSNKNYAVVWNDEGEVASFKDIWSGGIETYINWLYERVEEMYRLLKPTGSFYLHCDWHAFAEIKLYILDRIFGKENFKNEIIWYYRRWTNSSNSYKRMHDVIFFYTKSSKNTFNKIKIEPTRSQQKVIEKGYNVNSVKKSGKKILQLLVYNKRKVDNLVKLKKINLSKYGNIVYRENKLTEANDVFEIQYLHSQAKERIGYPTQKPEKLLERIISASSNKGDLVADFFLGGGTTIATAERLKRDWIGVDSSVAAVKITENRLHKMNDLFQKSFSVHIHKYDFETLDKMNAFEFEHFVVEQFGGVPNKKQRSDFGIDGVKTLDGIKHFLQIKQSKSIGRNVVDNFKAAIDRKKSKNGFILAWSFGRGAISETARLKREDNYNIKLIEIQTFIPISSKPEIFVTLTNDKNIFYFDASKSQSDAGIEFFSWDFDFQKKFKADILYDKKGTIKHKFKKGKYKIACKCVDFDGLENIEILKINVVSC